MYSGLSLHHVRAASGDPSAIICHFASVLSAKNGRLQRAGDDISTSSRKLERYVLVPDGSRKENEVGLIDRDILGVRRALVRHPD